MKNIPSSLWMLALAAMLIPAPRGIAQEAKNPASGELGRELKKIETDVKKAPEEATKKEPDVKLREIAPPKAEEKKAEADGGAVKPVQKVELRGDREILETTGLRYKLEAEVLGKKPTFKELSDIARKYQDELSARGYYLAQIDVVAADSKDGVAAFKVDAGRVGKISLKDKTTGGAYRGKYFSESQILRRLAALKPGDVFNYQTLYGAVYGINAHPDLTTDVDLNVRKAKEGEKGARYADMEFSIDEDFPLHAVLELGNEGTDVTEEWRAGLTLQHVNLTKHDDVLTLSAPFSLDLDTIKSVAGSYFFPHHLGQGGNFSAFAGYSELDAQDIVTGIDLDGEGWFVGAQGSYEVIDSPNHLLEASLGLTHRVIEDSLLLNNLETFPREVTLSPLTLSLMWTPLRRDRWGGQNYVASATSAHFGGFLGASDDEEFELQRENAPADYFVERLQYARVQPVFAKGRGEGDQWIWYSKLDAQIASDPLIPAEQKTLGGFNSVRGYIASEYLADSGITGTLELRTPIHRTSFIPSRIKRVQDPAKDFERTQFVAFLDAGYGELDQEQPGVDDSFSLVSVGLGVRVSVGTHVQARADWGFPLEETEDSDASGRGNFSLQMMF